MDNIPRRRYLAVVIGSTALSGCSEISNPENTTTQTESKEKPEMEINELEYDWKTGEMTLTTSVKLNQYDFIVIQENNKKISSSGTHEIIVSKPSTKLTIEYGTQSNNQSGTYEVSIPELISHPVHEKAFQSRFNELSITNGIEENYNKQYIERKFEWNMDGNTHMYSTQVPKQLYNYYLERHRIDDYKIYGSDPLDNDLINTTAQEFSEIGTDSEVVESVVKFIRDMKYTPDEVATGFNGYTKYPIETIVENGGDCEDTSLLLATILKTIGFDVRLIVLPDDNHIAVGISGVSDIEGDFFKQNDNRYYYLETTDTGWDVGEKPDEIQGTNVQLESITGHPVLIGVVQSNETTTGGAPKFNVEIENVSEYTAQEVTATIQLQDRSGTVISSTNITIDSLEESENIEKDVWLEPPNPDKEVRIRVQITENGTVHDIFSTKYI